MKRFYIYFLLIIGAATACTDDYISPIPDFPVSMQLNLSTNYPTFRNSVNEHLTFTTRRFEIDRIGYGGILVYTGFDEQYYAFDMACPYEVKTDVRVYPNGLGQAVCEECGTVYDISYGIGNPTSGPSKDILKRYKTSLTGDILYIYR